MALLFASGGTYAGATTLSRRWRHHCPPGRGLGDRADQEGGWLSDTSHARRRGSPPLCVSELALLAEDVAGIGVVFGFSARAQASPSAAASPTVERSAAF